MISNESEVLEMHLSSSGPKEKDEIELEADRSFFQRKSLPHPSKREDGIPKVQ